MAKQSHCLLVAAASLLLATASAQAVIIATGDGTGNTAKGTMPAGWNNVGSLYSGIYQASAVYIGQGWVLTAKHVGGVGLGTAVTFAGTGTFHSDGQVVRLKTGASDADLQMFHLSATPNLPALNIPTSSPSIGTYIYMAGYGQNRATDITYYSFNASDPDNWIWTEQAGPIGADASGYKYASGNTKRWGTNLTSVAHTQTGDVTTAVVNAGAGPTQVFFADFSGEDADTTYEAQLANGDSGGGVFDSSNNLIGLINYKGTYYGNQPTDTALFGNLSDMSDLSYYRSQILMVVPEPTTLTLLAAAGTLILLRRRRL